MKRQILMSLGMLVFVGAIIVGATGAFFTDTASSTGNTFAAGTLGLQLSNNTNGSGGYADTVASSWNFNGMAPGGEPSEDTVWLKNTGVIDAQSIGIAMANASGTYANIARQMRITKMTLDGKNLLVGGAGAEIAEYVSPTSCDITVGGGGNPSTITAAIAAATNGDVICATGTNYSSAWEGVGTINVNKEVTIVSMDGPSVTSSIGFDVAANNVTIKGFNIYTSNDTAVDVNGRSNVVITDNTFSNFGNIAGTTDKQAVYVHGASSNVTVSNNVFDGLQNGIKSIKAIYVGHTGDTNTVSNVTITNNIIKNVESASKGAYGILVNHGTPANGGLTTGLNINNNTISDLSGGWTHAIGLEGPTPGAIVTMNDIYNLTSPGLDVTAVRVEDNQGAGILVNENNFASDAFGVTHTYAAGFSVDATNNWWGDFDPSDQIASAGPTITTGSIAGGPFAGFVNGSDAFNNNGFADLQDLNNDPILDAGFGLDAGQKKQFIMAVQLDGPSTGNEFQGQSLTTDLVFTLNQQ